MEWHDGPDYSCVERALSMLPPEERGAAEALIAGRLSRDYDEYLGRAAVLLGTERCRRALEEVLDRERNPYAASSIAKHLLILGPSEKALDVLRAIIRDPAFGWSCRIDALVDLKIAMGSAGDNRPPKEWLPEDLLEILVGAVCDEDYLVRYHAAEALLRVAGVSGELSEERDLFPLICGKHGTEAPDDQDRRGFRQAALLLKKILRGEG